MEGEEGEASIIDYDERYSRARSCCVRYGTNQSDDDHDHGLRVVMAEDTIHP